MSREFDDEMEMPCVCRCGKLFDLLEGNTSHKTKDLICDDCYGQDEQEKEREQDIEDATERLEDAIITIQDAMEELEKLGKPYTKEIKFNHLRA